MKRETVLSLRQTVWFAPVPGDPLEVAVVPSEARSMVGGDESVAEKAFIDFRGYTNGDGPVANTREARLELLGVMSVRGAIIQKLMALNEEVGKGEGIAGSV